MKNHSDEHMKNQQLHTQKIEFEYVKDSQTIDNKDIVKLHKKRKINNKLIAIIVIAVLLVTTALFFLIPYLITPKFDSENPIARMELSNGMTIDYEIFADEVPRASGVFIYLAQQGFFDDTIIVDLQYNYVRFGGYTSYKNTSHKENDQKTIDKLNKQLDFDKNIPQQWKDKPLSYRIMADNNEIVNKYDQEYYLSYIRSTATEFQVSGASNYPPVLYPSSYNAPTIDLSQSPNSSIAFAKAYDTKSQNNIKALSNMTKVDTKDNRDYHLYYQPPVKTIKIKIVKIYNLKGEFKQKYNNFNLYKEFFNNSAYWLGSDINTTPSVGWSSNSRLIRDN